VGGGKEKGWRRLGERKKRFGLKDSCLGEKSPEKKRRFGPWGGKKRNHGHQKRLMQNKKTEKKKKGGLRQRGGQIDVKIVSAKDEDQRRKRIRIEKGSPSLHS